MTINAELVYYMHRQVIPDALALLPGRMDSAGARAMLIAIGLQESRFRARRQLPVGPARGFWQFERGGGVAGVLRHQATAGIVRPVLALLNYPPDPVACHAAIEHNDLLACVFARLLLWTVPGVLPSSHETERGWQYYLSGWRPGKPHRQTWDGFYQRAWTTVSTE